MDSDRNPRPHKRGALCFSGADYFCHHPRPTQRLTAPVLVRKDIGGCQQPGGAKRCKGSQLGRLELVHLACMWQRLTEKPGAIPGLAQPLTGATFEIAGRTKTTKRSFVRATLRLGDGQSLGG